MNPNDIKRRNSRWKSKGVLAYKISPLLAQLSIPFHPPPAFTSFSSWVTALPALSARLQSQESNSGPEFWEITAQHVTRHTRLQRRCANLLSNNSVWHICCALHIQSTLTFYYLTQVSQLHCVTGNEGKRHLCVARRPVIIWIKTDSIPAQWAPPDLLLLFLSNLDVQWVYTRESCFLIKCTICHPGPSQFHLF